MFRIKLQHPVSILTTNSVRWGMDFVTRMGPLQRVDSKNPTTAVVAQRPLTESQWVSKQKDP